MYIYLSIYNIHREKERKRLHEYLFRGHDDIGWPFAIMGLHRHDGSPTNQANHHHTEHTAKFLLFFPLLVPSSTQKRRWNFFFSFFVCIIFSRISKNVKPIGKRKYLKIPPSEPDSYSLLHQDHSGIRWNVGRMLHQQLQHSSIRFSILFFVILFPLLPSL